LLGLSLLFEGPHSDWDALRTTLTWDALSSLLGLLYIVIIATLIGYGL
jgi:O-acetylserine/cysteine efflux transporter